MAKGLDSQFARARAAEARGDFPAAAEIYYAIIARYPANVRAQQAVIAMKQRIADQSGPAVQQTFLDLLSAYNQGRIAEVLEGIEPLVAAHPGQPALHNLMGAALLAARRPIEGEAAFRRAIALEPAIADGYNNLGNALKDQFCFDEACVAYRAAIHRRQDYHEAWNNLGTALQALENYGEALAAYDTALALKGDYADALNNRATALQEMDRLAEAEAGFRRALELDPARPPLFSNLGECLLRQERTAEAAAAFRQAVALDPDYADGWNNLGVALRRSGDAEGSLQAYERAMALAPAMAAVRSNRANMMLDQGKADEASLDYLATLEKNPQDTNALNNLGAILQDQGHFGHALMLFDRALAIDPDFVEAQVNRGNALRDMGWAKEAEEALSAALTGNPKVAALWSNLAVARQDLGQTESAIEAYTKALEIDPAMSEARMQRLYQRAQLCDWSIYRELDAELALIDAGKEECASFPALGMKDDPGFQYRRSAGLAAKWAKVPAEPLPASEDDTDRRIRIGYFSGDFHDHAIMYLASGLFREHDKSHFEVFCYSSGQVRHGVLRDRLIADVEHFHDTLEMAEQDVFELARGHGLDIAVDVSGFTRGNRTGLFARRVAPVQVNYLGYPGTMAAPFMDYIVVDKVLVPAEEREHVSERLMVMPGAYQPNDNSRVIADSPVTRAEFGLPDNAFVFCCFNQGFKITPREFDIWMRLLGAAEGSVLWLLVGNQTARANLRREAEARGIDPARLVFAEARHHGEHLARHRLADLFLDTFAYNAHTTMSDALWSGLPAVTRLGRQFAARVGASLLTNTGMEELVTTSDADYEALALALARDPARLAALRARLTANLPSAPLFDTVGYARALESGFSAALGRQRRGLPPEDFAVAPGRVVVPA
ncbi:tetratricopeptide repeat protein [Novosphingobium flavum]|uniref:protein O-GlcNAc transferase n=1 Tax=Novosphingobium flavum TaxID=1778672 RepID=A0A7X1KMN9_9SPHN|nr:tetratricopeptide repeat protein [Novosphingobium flavum]MBC2666822.1 tetratricopeptide repeat protein [Novosphingobium flavum]